MGAIAYEINVINNNAEPSFVYLPRFLIANPHIDPQVNADKKAWANKNQTDITPLVKKVSIVKVNPVIAHSTTAFCWVRYLGISNVFPKNPINVNVSAYVLKCRDNVKGIPKASP